MTGKEQLLRRLQVIQKVAQRSSHAEYSTRSGYIIDLRSISEMLAVLYNELSGALEEEEDRCDNCWRGLREEG